MVFMVKLVSSYPEMKTKGYEVADKTMLIEDLLESTGMSSLYLRPRRYGKTLAVSMLDSFLNMRYEGNNWFEGTEIMGCPDAKEHMNAYPVIKLDLKGMSDTGFPETVESLKEIMANQCSLFPELFESGRVDRGILGILEEIRNRTCGIATLHRSVLTLSMALSIHYGTRVVLLIDEYDAILNSTAMKPWHEDVLGLMRNFLSSALKTNDYLLFGFMTGVTEMGKASILSGLNNLYVNDVTCDDYPERFGLTDSEVRTWCRKKSLECDRDEEDIFREIKEWYDGYTFGETRVFNPWSVVNYLGSMRARPYWVNSGSTEIVRDLLSTHMHTLHDALNKLASCQPVVSVMRSGVTYASLRDNPSNVFTYLAMCGYLTVQGDWNYAEFRIPNKEIREMFEDLLHQTSGISEPQIRMRMLADALLGADLEVLPSCIDEVIMDFFTGYHPRTEEGYQTMIAACAFSLGADFEVKTEYPSGKGRADVWIRRIRGSGVNMVMELKKLQDGDDPYESAEEALAQILGKRYTRTLKGRTLVYGIALGGGVPVLRFRELSDPFSAL